MAAKTPYQQPVPNPNPAGAQKITDNGNTFQKGNRFADMRARVGQPDVQSDLKGLRMLLGVGSKPTPDELEFLVDVPASEVKNLSYPVALFCTHHEYEGKTLVVYAPVIVDYRQEPICQPKEVSVGVGQQQLYLETYASALLYEPDLTDLLDGYLDRVISQHLGERPLTRMTHGLVINRNMVDFTQLMSSDEGQAKLRALGNMYRPTLSQQLVSELANWVGESTATRTTLDVIKNGNMISVSHHGYDRQVDNLGQPRRADFSLSFKEEPIRQVEHKRSGIANSLFEQVTGTNETTYWGRVGMYLNLGFDSTEAIEAIQPNARVLGDVKTLTATIVINNVQIAASDSWTSAENWLSIVAMTMLSAVGSDNMSDRKVWRSAMNALKKRGVNWGNLAGYVLNTEKGCFNADLDGSDGEDAFVAPDTLADYFDERRVYEFFERYVDNNVAWAIRCDDMAPQTWITSTLLASTVDNTSRQRVMSWLDNITSGCFSKHWDPKDSIFINPNHCRPSGVYIGTDGRKEDVHNYGLTELMAMTKGTPIGEDLAQDFVELGSFTTPMTEAQLARQMTVIRELTNNNVNFDGVSTLLYWNPAAASLLMSLLASEVEFKAPNSVTGIEETYRGQLIMDTNSLPNCTANTRMKGLLQAGAVRGPGVRHLGIQGVEVKGVSSGLSGSNRLTQRFLRR